MEQLKGILDQTQEKVKEQEGLMRLREKELDVLLDEKNIIEKAKESITEKK